MLETSLKASLQISILLQESKKRKVASFGDLSALAPLFREISNQLRTDILKINELISYLDEFLKKKNNQAQNPVCQDK